MTYFCQPQVKDLPRDSHIDITCQTCATSWSQSVRDLIERRLGAQFVDLLEFETQCHDAFCEGPVVFAYEGKPEVAPLVAQVVTLPRTRTLTECETTPYPVKAVVKPRRHAPTPYALPQYTLPMAMPPLRPTQAGRIVSVAGR